MIIYGRDARTGPRSLKHLFSGQYRNPEANRLSGIYELSLRRASEAGSPGRNVRKLLNFLDMYAKWLINIQFYIQNDQGGVAPTRYKEL